jgi:hypothetical protein
MARQTLTLRCLVCAFAVMAPGLAFAQETTTAGPKDLTRSTMDPVDKIVGMWQVGKVDGATTSDTLEGGVLQIDRQAVTTLESGTCTNPRFIEQLGTINIECLGQGLASASWDPQAPGKLQWSEGGLTAALRRISGTETLQSPATEGGDDQAAPAEEDGSDEGEGDEQAQ